MEKLIEDSFSKLIRYVESEGFRGYDPFDALNSNVLEACARNSRWMRIILIQLLKKTAFNFRPILGISKGYNPKGLGLFLSSYIKLYMIYKKESYLERIMTFVNMLKENRSDKYSSYCWGYNFHWNNRAMFQPKYSPTIVVTSFVANAFLDAYEILKNEEYLKIARSSCDFILSSIKRTYENGTFCWSYSPIDETQVYNASILGSRLLARVYSFSKEAKLIDEAKKSVEFVINHQNEDGSWFYGCLPCQQWIDSFHTGYNLECIYDFMRFSKIDKYQENFEKGLNFYKKNFFLYDFTPKYYHNKIYPIDIHCPAQAIVCFSKFGDTETARNIAIWTINNMQDKQGYFYYQKHKFFINKIPYMRWSQAWMLYSLSTLMRGLQIENLD